MKGFLQGRQEWLHHLSQTYLIPEATLDRLWEEFLAFSDWEVGAFVAARHLQLQAEGVKNPTIYGLLQKEVRERRFKAAECSLRQIRRMIYG